MTKNLSTYYQQRVDAFTTELKEKQRQSRQLATIRLGVLAIAIVLFTGIFKTEFSALMSIGSLVFLTGFILLVKRHFLVKRDIKRLRFLVSINENELKALAGDFSFNSEGRHHLNFDHANAFDLDLFGKTSFYQRVYRGTTKEGDEHTANAILFPRIEEIEVRQAYLKELSEKVDWRQKYQAEGLLQQGESGYKGLQSWIEAPLEFANSKVIKYQVLVSPIVFVAIMLLYAFSLIPSAVPTVYFLLQLAMGGVHLKKINRFHGALSKKQNELDAYANLLDMTLGEEFVHPVLSDLRNKARGGSAAIKQFGKLIGLLDSRLNMIMGILLNGAFLWDLRYVRKIENWKLENADKLKGWVDVIAQFESHNSFANYVFNHPEFCWPVTAKEDALNSTELGHPFLDAKNRVCNDFKLLANGQLVLLSGANMSGKSTFLRTVGLNLVMAQMGLPVCAKSFSFKPIPVYTSMRINDSLQESESYFFAELKRLKYIIDIIKGGKEIFVLLDEILRGTNSNDKHKGSIGLIEQLTGLKTSGIIASHDITLASLADKYPEKVLNRSFEVENEGGELVFDYTLREGVCQNLNASYLMKKMGVI